MAEAMELLTRRIEFLPGSAEEVDAWLEKIPARWAVALLADQGEKPVQLLSVRDLRLALRNRMTEPPAPGRRVNWREVVRFISWQAVDSEFEAGWVYLEAARRFLPEVYREMVQRVGAWFLHVDPEESFPRYVKTTDLSARSGALIGPLADKHAAGRLIERIEDAFDLCRYHQILTQYPTGKACAYKEMGKCPAPCDGSISIEQYRRMVQISLAGILETGHLIEQQTRRMEAAALELRFEAAARIKAYVETLGEFAQPAWRHARPIEAFAYAAVQRGPKAKSAKVFLVLPGVIEPVVCLRNEKCEAREVVHAILTRAEDYQNSSTPPPPAAEWIGLAARFLFASKGKSGVFVPLRDLNEVTLVAAHRATARKPRTAAAKPDMAALDGYDGGGELNA